ncbi:Por secretion system C-terminal sorting domain-containing protein [Formosa sp. Hel1_31_208]|uniref:zinc-dependent metalloprotease n=1 Tax=Formosa sp. Hel1_31_208 TaxID=1798225 RepID=UPI00087C2AA4|nr:zinc-dependent metalloprotease family protein [Formosa sp. Hel1_31_208]SDR69045.1 Por secretion system C-terminal sorting domain-containing protein [Formosa sp. Hel1_31_208]
MKKTLLTLTVILLCLSMTSGYSQSPVWQAISKDSRIENVSLKALDENHFRLFQFDVDNFKSELIEAPLRSQSGGKSNVSVDFPDVFGKLQQYRIVETQIFSSQDNAAQHPNIKTYLGSQIDNPGARVRFSVTPLGLNAMISVPGEETFFIQPVTKVSNGQYLVYNKSARQAYPETFECLTDDLDISKEAFESSMLNRDANDQQLRTFRIAISVTQEYTAFWDDGNSVNGIDRQDALAQMVSTLNRTNEVFEVDMAITFQLVDTADDPAIDLIYSPSFPDPYGANLNAGLQSNLTATVGESDYDIGHLFDFGGNTGNAGCIGCVCTNGKGSGFSSHSFLDNDGGPYFADFFDIDYVPHEIGHQMGANHTWSFSSEGTGVNAEPGSGTTIMGYAGITGGNDVQDHSDPYFHYYSILQILNNVISPPNNCATITAITNSPPVADAGTDYTIPSGTAFVLRGAATDPDGTDVLTYCWEQIDNGVTTNGTFGPNKTTGAVWRSRPPSVSPNRYMPILERVLNGQLTETNPVETVDNSSWETVSNVGRDLNFALTVRDRSEAGGVGQSPQSDFDLMTVTVDAASGPFAVTSQTTNESWDAGSTQTITWDVAGTDIGTVNTPTVNILLSVDGGQTFPFVMASGVANDGSHDVTVPVTGGDTTTARVIVEGNNNIFYAVNPINFSIQESEYVITVDNTELDVCQPSDAIYNFMYNTFLGFTGTTNFSVTGLPGGLNASINPTSATADGTTGTLTISGTQNVATGSYPFTFEGISGTNTKTVDLILNIFNDTITPAVLTMPANTAVDVSAEVEFMWNASANAQDYLIEIASDSNFTAIIDSANVQTTTYVSGSLGANTLYFWRVTASNLCGVANASAVFSFTTANLTCDSFIDDVQQTISPSGAGNTLTSTITVTEDFPVTDVNVTLNITHTWVSDLEITLTSPQGTVVDLIFDEGGNGDNLVNTTFDQEGTDGSIVGAAAPFTGSFLPEGDLSTIYGETSGGDWVLTVVDDANLDGGTFDSFELFLCVQGSLSVADSEFDNSNFIIYPNPNTGEFNVVLNNAATGDVKITVFDIRGRRIFNNTYEGSPAFNQTINLGNAQAGVYLVTVDDGLKKATKRIVVE